MKCSRCQVDKEETEFRRHAGRRQCKSCEVELHVQWGRKNLRTVMLYSAKHRAKRDGLPFSLKISDIVIPDVCPVLGYKLIAGDRHNHDFAPTIDRIKPELGYVPGNIVIVCHRANLLKNDATLDELEKIVNFYRGSSHQWSGIREIRACVHNPTAEIPECLLCYKLQ